MKAFFWCFFLQKIPRSQLIFGVLKKYILDLKVLIFSFEKRGTTFSDMDAGRSHFLGSQRVELKARPFFLLALRAGRPREVGFY